jgi:hypothetical protein
MYGMNENLIPDHTYYEHLAWLQPGVTEWYQSTVETIA